MRQPGEQQAYLGAGAAPELEKGAAGRDEPADRLGMVGQDAEFGAGRIILVERGDLLEQFRADPIVEMLGRQHLRTPREPRQEIARKFGPVIGERREGGRGRFQHAPTSREPKGLLILPSMVNEPQAGELPAVVRVEKVAIAQARMAIWSCRRTATQHHLVDHELAVVFAQRAGLRAIAG